MVEYPWYQLVEKTDELLQGDLITECPILVPESKIVDGTIKAKAIEYDVVVMSQSCDLENGKVEIVLVCPIWAYKIFAEEDPQIKSKGGKEKLKQGVFVGYHLLDKSDDLGVDLDYQVVDFRNVFGVHVDVLKSICAEKEKRLRLLPPYREHLSQAFARFFMRVGLPSPIDFWTKPKKMFKSESGGSDGDIKIIFDEKGMGKLA